MAIYPHYPGIMTHMPHYSIAVTLLETEDSVSGQRPTSRLSALTLSYIISTAVQFNVISYHPFKIGHSREDTFLYTSAEKRLSQNNKHR